jgi:hypothetical protein
MFTSDPPPGMPLEPYFAALRHEDEVLGPGLSRAQDKREKDMEDEIARCMAGAGFVYYPMGMPSRDETSDRAVATQEDNNWYWDRLPVPQLGATREDVAANGYGRWDENSGSAIVMTPENEDLAAAMIAADPNTQYMASLSESGLNAYMKALDGMEPAGPNEWAGASGFLGEGDSCRDQAWRKFPNLGVEDALTDYAQQDLVGGMVETQYLTDNDPRTLALDREWAACMAGEGYDVGEEHAVGDGGGEGVISGPIQSFYLAVRTGADSAVAPRDQYLSWELPLDQRSLIQSAPEIAIALADFDCREQTDYMAQLSAIQLEFETAFVANNRKALDDMLVAIDANIAAG